MGKPSHSPHITNLRKYLYQKSLVIGLQRQSPDAGEV